MKTATDDDHALNGAFIAIVAIIVYCWIVLACRNASDVEPVPADMIEESSR